MEMVTRLEKHRSNLLRRIATAAQKGETTAVMAHTNRLQRVERLISQLEEVDREVRALEDVETATSEPALPPQREGGQEQTEGSAWRSSGKERGARRRLEFLKNLPPRARPADPVTGAVFKAPKLRLRIGVAYAHEGDRVNKWFLGLHEAKFDHAVLLCESRDGRVRHFSLPKEFMAQHRHALSRKNSQLKFNVVKRGGGYFLLVRPGRHINLEEFRDNYYGLR